MLQGQTCLSLPQETICSLVACGRKRTQLMVEVCPYTESPHCQGAQCMP